MPTSFRLDLSSRPTRYRTPSPPRQAVEPISPTSTASLVRLASGGANNIPPRHGPTNTLQSQQGPVEKSRIHGHRSTGSMEIFAEIALSTQSMNQTSTGNLPSKRSLSGPDTNFPPSKRSRSEKLPSPDVSRKQAVTGMRPATSHEQTPQSKLLEAELLLNFSQTARLAYSPPTIQKIQDAQHGSQAPHEAALESSSSSLPSLHQLKEASKGADSVGRSNVEAGQQHVQLRGGERSVVAASSPLARLPQSPGTGTQPLRSTPAKVSAQPVGSNDSPWHSISKQISGDFTKGNGGSEARESDHLGQRLDPQATSVQPQEMPEDDLTGNESRLMHGPLRTTTDAAGEPSAAKTDMAPPQETGNADQHHAEDLPKASMTPDATPAAETSAIDNPRSTAAASFCAACNFARNSLNVEGENNATSWISCDACKSWFHFACAGFKNEREVRAVDKFRCKKCKPVHGSTTYVRKSSRAHSAIDYAGLHQGVIKTSDERMEHHYIQPIKDGIITFLPENFARMRPELVTAEFFEKSGGMKEPIVIPAEWNPRPASAPTADSAENQPSAGLVKTIDAEDLFAGDSEDQIVPDDGQDALDMVIPQGLTVRQVAELYGPDEKVEVIDVKSQNGENKKWNMRRWAEYYENPNNKVVRNVISLEVSQSKLGRLIRRPKIVRDLDLQDSVWPEDLLAKGEYPRVQFYCLMSVADCFTDFHIDFGGSSVFYHILKGKKTFLFIPPKEKHLKKYEEWCMSPAQNWTFLADQTKECYRVDLSEGDTMLIPSGWIHAVWTPEDSLVIGGNFLTRMNFAMQLRVAQVEKATGVGRKFRYPHFQKIHWYTAFRYMEKDPLPESVKEQLYSGKEFHREQPSYFEFDAWGENSRSGKENYHARYYSQSEMEGLRDLTAYLLRTALIDTGKITEGITAETRNAVKKSIPRSHGEPIDVVKDFAAWSAWKRGNETIDYWAYPGAEPEGPMGMVPEKLSAATVKKLDREAALQAALAAPRRQSARRQSIQRATPPRSYDGISDQIVQDPSTPFELKRPAGDDYALGQDTSMLVSEANKKRRTSSGPSAGSNRKTACEACRKRRRACKHKDQVEGLSQSSSAHGVSPQSSTNQSQSIQLGAINATPQASGSDVVHTVPQIFDIKNTQITTSSSSNTDQPQYSPITVEGSVDAAERDRPNGMQSLEQVSGNAGLSRPRTKACNDCRKSKRRCVHDAFGNEDPVKAAEQAIPRPHARKNHRASELQAASPLSKDEQKTPQEQPRMMAPIANMISAPQPLSQSISTSPQEAPKPGTPSVDAVVVVPDLSLNEALAVAQTISTRDKLELIAVAPDIQENDKPSNENEQSAPAQVDTSEMVPEIGADEAFTEPGEAAPASSLMSPPASSNDDTGGSPINATTVIYSPSPPTSRHPSQQPPKETRRTQQHYTPESGTLRRASFSSSEPQQNENGRTALDEPSVCLPKQDLGLSEDTMADEESLRLIKELQAQDYGLRRRGKA